MKYSVLELAQFVQQRKFSVVEQEVIFLIKFSIEINNVIEPTSTNALLANTSIHEQEYINFAGSYANIIVQLFCTPGYTPSDAILDLFITQKEMLELLFSLSAWKNTDPIIEKFSLTTLIASKKSRLSKKQERLVKVFLALVCLGSKHKIPWSYLFSICPEVTLYAYIGMVNQTPAVLTDERNNNYNNLLAAARDFPSLSITEEKTISYLYLPYFRCSYATGKDKYELKKWIAKLLLENCSNFLSETSLNYIHNCENKALAEKPQIGVILEIYHPSHAMFRCYNTLMLNLAKHFKLIAFYEESTDFQKIDSAAFSEVVAFKKNDTFDTRVSAIISYELDMIYYPSIGMRAWAICLAFVRLAPIQFMTAGHPSSSYSDSIDYFVIPENAYSTTNLQTYINEKLVLNECSSTHMNYVTRPSDLTNEFVSEYSQFLPSQDVMKIGINGVIRKVTTEVLDICKQISRQANKPVKFVFFVKNPKFHFKYLSIKLQLMSHNIDFELACYTDYLSYMKKLSECHLLLPTLPFGGSNSNIDAMVLKKPKPYLLQQKQIYTRSDEMDWNAIGMAELLENNSAEQLINRAVELIDDEDARYHCFEIMQSKCSTDKIFHPIEDKNSSSIVSHVMFMLNEKNSALKLAG